MTNVGPRCYFGAMTDLTTQQRLFLASDAALREVIDQFTPATLELAVPAEWSSNGTTTMLGLLANHAKDEAWVPDVIAGKTMDEVGDAWTGDLLADDPTGNYDKLNDLATAAVSKPLVEGQVAHLSYGEFPVADFLEHTSYYRGFQAPLIAQVADIPFHMSDELVDLLWSTVEPQLEMLRSIHVFGPAVAVPPGSDRQTQLLGLTGFWRG
jgi:hypothetical protein